MPAEAVDRNCEIKLGILTAMPPDILTIYYTLCAQAREPCYYIMDLGDGLYIDARNKGNMARLLNSRCGLQAIRSPHVICADHRKGSRLYIDARIIGTRQTFITAGVSNTHAVG